MIVVNFSKDRGSNRYNNRFMNVKGIGVLLFFVEVDSCWVIFGVIVICFIL